MNDHDYDRLKDEALRRYPVSQLLAQYGRNPGKTMDCPFCHGKKKASVREYKGIEWFKCWKSSCPTEGKTMHSLDLYLFERPGAFKEFFQQAGVWREERLAPSILPGSPRRKRTPPQPERRQKTEDRRQKAETVDDLSGETAGGPGGDPDAKAKGSGAVVNQATDVGPVLEKATAPSEASSRMQETTKQDEGNSGTEKDKAAPPPPSDGGSEVAEGVEPGNVVHLEAGQDGARRESGPTGDEDEDEDEGEEWVPGRAALQAFWERTSLLPEDQHKLWVKRGLLPDVSRELGLRSSPAANKKILEDLANEFSEGELMEAGLYRVDQRSGVCEPNRQFFGFANTGRKDEKGMMVRAWLHPVLIPYFDAKGRVLRLRPHRDFVAGQDPLLYVVRSPEVKIPDRIETLVVTEGEFKAVALYQVLGRVESGSRRQKFTWACCVPGIAVTKRDGGGWFAREMLDEVLQQSRPAQVVIAFDHEDKSDKDERDRYDTQAWARYLAGEVTKLGYATRICLLPKEWMIDRKADWDGALAMLINRFSDTDGDG